MSCSFPATLWWTNIFLWKITMLLMGKLTISMAIFNCYVSSPEGISCSRFHMFHHSSTSTFYGAQDFDVEWCRYLQCNNWSTSSSKGHRLVLRRLDVDRHRQFGTGQTIHGLLQAGCVHRETSASPPVILLGRMADQPQIILQPKHGQLIIPKILGIKMYYCKIL